jgi:hypothetical protein
MSITLKTCYQIPLAAIFCLTCAACQQSPEGELSPVEDRQGSARPGETVVAADNRAGTAVG